MAEANLNAQLSGDEEDTLEGKYLTFALGDEEYGVEIRNVTEIVGVTPITHVPDTPHYLRGVINLRGKVIPVIDMRLYFNLEFREYDDRTCFIVTEVDELLVALVVDYVCEVTTIDDISPVPNQGDQTMEYMQGIGKMPSGIKLLLNIHKLLGVDSESTDANIA
jgi:purine-binding chemotaxis protein CheW